MRRWIVAGLIVAFLSVVMPVYTTLWLMYSAVTDIEERRQTVELARQEQIEAVQGSQECVLRLLLVRPDQREGFTVDRILDACPDALPEREEGDQDSDDEFDTGAYPDSRQPWEAEP